MRSRLTILLFAVLFVSTTSWALEQTFFLQAVAQAHEMDTVSADTSDTSAEAALACSDFDLVEKDFGPFSLALPSDMVKQDVQGVDSYVGRYTRNQMTLKFDYGWHSPSAGGTSIVIDRRPAKISRFSPTSREGTIYVPNTAYPVTIVPDEPTVQEEVNDHYHGYDYGNDHYHDYDHDHYHGSGPVMGIPVDTCCIDRLYIAIRSTQAEDAELANCILESFSLRVPEPGIKLTKTAGDAANGDVYAVYDDYDVTFTYIVTNTGNTHLTNIVIADDMGTPNDVYDDILLVDSACAGLGGPLPPAASVTCQATRVISDTVITTAIASGTPTDEDGNDTEAESPVDHDHAEILIAEPAIEVSRTVIRDPQPEINGIVRFVITNTGNVPVTDVVVTDSFERIDEVGQIETRVTNAECPGLDELAVGKVLTCTVHINMHDDHFGVAIVLGSVNCDDQVDITDAIFIMQYRAGLRSDSSSCASPIENSLYAAAGDVNADNKTDVRDVVIIFECVMGISNGLCPNVDPDAADQLSVEASALVDQVKQMLIDEGAWAQSDSSIQIHMPFVIR